MRFPKKMEKYERIFRIQFQIPEILVIQFPSFTLSKLKLAENFGFLHIFQQYKQQSCSLLVPIRILQKFTNRVCIPCFLLLGIYFQDLNKSRLKCDNAKIKTLSRSSSFHPLVKHEKMRNEEQDKTGQFEKLKKQTLKTPPTSFESKEVT